MNISATFVKRPVMTILCMASILFFGLFAFQRLPVSDLPPVEYPTIQVTTAYPGASPDTVASNVTAILEKQFSTIDGVNLITSTSTTGSSNIVLQFKLSKSLDRASLDVLSAINKAQALLPLDLPYLPTYTKVNPSASPILYLAVTSPTITQWDLYDYANTMIGQRINIIEGVAQVLTYGSPYAVRVRVDPRKLASRNIGLDEVGTRIRNQNVNIPVGTLYGTDKEYTLNVDGQLFEAAAYNPMILRSEDGGAITRISDIGYAMDSLLNDKTLLAYIEKDLHQPTVILAILKQGGTNTLSILKDIDAVLPEILEALPSSLQIKRLFDRGIFIKESVHDVEMTLLIAFVLVVAVIFFYLGEWIATIIPTLALPIAVIGTFAAMFILHFSVDVLSLLAITLSIGFLVDDAVVVLENIVRHVELGKKSLAAALEGSREICFTIVSMTMCLIAVFIPLIFMGGILGKIFREFGVTIVAAVFISGLVSISLTPMLASRFMQPKQTSTKSWAKRISDRLNSWLLSLYRPSLKWALRHPKTLLTCGLFSLVATFYLIAVLPKDFLPSDDLGFIQVFSETADGTSPFLMQNYQKALTEKTVNHPAIESIASINGTPRDNQGIMFLRLKSNAKRPPINKVIEELKSEAAQIPGLRVFYKPLPLINLQVGTSQAQANYQYNLHSFSEKALYPAAEKLINKMKGSSSLTQVGSDLHISQPQYQMHIRRDRASLLGVTARSIEMALNLAFATTQLSPINTRNTQYYVVLETMPEFYKDPNALRQLYVSSLTGNLVPLYTLVTPKETIGPMSVTHLNALPSVTITFDLAEGVPLGTAVKEIQSMASTTLPSNVVGELLGTASAFKESFSDLHLLLLITIFIVYVILGILYENFFHPLTVLSTLPPAALGGLLTLLLFGVPLSLYAFVGMIMLLGIVMKNGIIMVDFANVKLDQEGKDLYTAITESCLTRLRPILMTTVAAAMGAVPIALGIGGLTALSRRPLGIVIIGGLIFSQILTLYLTPVIFIEIERFREKFFPKKTSLPAPPP